MTFIEEVIDIAKVAAQIMFVPSFLIGLFVGSRLEKSREKTDRETIELLREIRDGL